MFYFICVYVPLLDKYATKCCENELKNEKRIKWNINISFQIRKCNNDHMQHKHF